MKIVCANVKNHNSPKIDKNCTYAIRVYMFMLVAAARSQEAQFVASLTPTGARSHLCARVVLSGSHVLLPEVRKAQGIKLIMSTFQVNTVQRKVCRARIVNLFANSMRMQIISPQNWSTQLFFKPQAKQTSNP